MIEIKSVLRLIGFVIAWTIYSGSLWAQERTVILVRHAEKDTTVKEQPLTLKGHERAKSLADMFRSVPISMIAATQALRTQQTVAPLSEQSGIPVTIVRASFDSIGHHARAMLERVRETPPGSVIVIASHSNVIPHLVRTFGVSDSVYLADDQYDDVFLIRTADSGRSWMMNLKMKNEK